MIIRIDLGTTNSLAACFRNGKAEIIPNRLGKHLTPSVVSVDADGTVYVGETAKERGALHPLETARVFKAAEACKCAFPENNEITISCTIGGQTYDMPLTLSEYEKACTPLLEKLRRPIERSLRDAGISLSDIDQIVLVGGATRLPVIRRFVTRLFGRIPGILVDPDEAVALGAALQCGMKARDKEIQEVVLTDVCPYTLGTEIVASNGVFEENGHYLPIIERNTVIPVSRTQTVYTAHDNQTRVSVKVLQGESRMAYHNLQLGEISVPVPSGPKGKEAVDITYTYDVNALLEVEVFVHSTGVRRKIIIQNEHNRISEDEAAARLEKLQYLKQNPRDEEANRLQVLRGERLYEEAPGKRHEIDHALMAFEQVLSRQDRTEIEQARKQLTRLLDEIEFNLT